MKLVLVICRSSLERDVLSVIEAAGVSAFSIVPAVLGIGQSGKALHDYPWPGSNVLILIALDAQHADLLIDALVAFRDSAQVRQHGAHLPLRAFAIPCVEVL